MLVDKTNFGLVLHNHANFYWFEETSSYWSVKRISVCLCFSFVNQRHTSGITVYNRTVINIENTVRAVHSCNSLSRLFSKANNKLRVFFACSQGALWHTEIINADAEVLRSKRKPFSRDPNVFQKTVTNRSDGQPVTTSVCHKKRCRHVNEM